MASTYLNNSEGALDTGTVQIKSADTHIEIGVHHTSDITIQDDFLQTNKNTCMNQ